MNYSLPMYKHDSDSDSDTDSELDTFDIPSLEKQLSKNNSFIYKKHHHIKEQYKNNHQLENLHDKYTRLVNKMVKQKKQLLIFLENLKKYIQMNSLSKKQLWMINKEIKKIKSDDII